MSKFRILLILKVTIFFLLWLSNQVYSQENIPDSLIDNSKPGLDISAGTSFNQNQNLFHSLISSQKIIFKNKTAYNIRLFFLKKEKFKYGLEVNLNSFKTSFDSVDFSGNNLIYATFFEFKGKIKPTNLFFALGTSLGLSMESNTLFYKNTPTNNVQFIFTRTSNANQYIYNSSFEPITLFFGSIYWRFDKKYKTELFFRGNYFLNLNHFNNQFDETRSFKNGFSFLIGFSVRFKQND